MACFIILVKIITMSEIVYKLFFFVMLVMFFSFGFFIKVRLDYWRNFHWLDFVWIDKDFIITTWKIDYSNRNIIYVNKIPNQCKNWNKNSIKCLAALKRQVGIYNWLSFFSWSNLYK